MTETPLCETGFAQTVAARLLAVTCSERTRVRTESGEKHGVEEHVGNGYVEVKGRNRAPFMVSDECMHVHTINTAWTIAFQGKVCGFRSDLHLEAYL